MKFFTAASVIITAGLGLTQAKQLKADGESVSMVKHTNGYYILQTGGDAADFEVTSDNLQASPAGSSFKFFAQLSLGSGGFIAFDLDSVLPSGGFSEKDGKLAVFDETDVFYLCEADGKQNVVSFFNDDTYEPYASCKETTLELQ